MAFMVLGTYFQPKHVRNNLILCESCPSFTVLMFFSNKTACWMECSRFPIAVIGIFSQATDDHLLQRLNFMASE